VLEITTLIPEEGPPTLAIYIIARQAIREILAAVKQSSTLNSQEGKVARTKVLDCYRNDTACPEL